MTENNGFFTPSQILDIDNGIDFTFEGLGLKGNRQMKQYTIAMTCSGGTAIAGDYIADTTRKALAMAKKEHGNEWSYYVHEKKKIGLAGRHYFIARYWNDVDNQLEFDEPYTRIGKMRYGNEKNAEKDLKSALKNSDDKDWQIFWINTDRDKD